jgi:hypothetical protein
VTAKVVAGQVRRTATMKMRGNEKSRLPSTRFGKAPSMFARSYAESRDRRPSLIELEREEKRGPDRALLFRSDRAEVAAQIRRARGPIRSIAHKIFSDNFLKYIRKDERAAHPCGFGIVSESSKLAADPRLASTRLDLQSPLVFPSMERSVNTNLFHSPTSLFNVGVRFQSARAAWLARVQIANAFRT